MEKADTAGLGRGYGHGHGLRRGCRHERECPSTIVGLGPGLKPEFLFSALCTEAKHAYSFAKVACLAY